MRIGLCLLEIALPLVNALSAAHEQGITHRDLKPANIMVSASGSLKVVDFGLADVGEPPASSSFEDDDTLELADAGNITGTLPYMAPEQLLAEPLDHRVDIFSLGVILYEMATGKRPFEGKSSLALNIAHNAAA